jgi:hypothetical protein
VLVIVKPAHEILLKLDSYRRVYRTTLQRLDRCAFLWAARVGRFCSLLRTGNQNLQDKGTELGPLLVLAHALPSALGLLQVRSVLENCNASTYAFLLRQLWYL